MEKKVLRGTAGCEVKNALEVGDSSKISSGIKKVRLGVAKDEVFCFYYEEIKYLHNEVIEAVAEEYDLVADGTRRDDKTPKLNRNQIQSLEARKNVQYVNLDSFGHKTVKYLMNELFELKHEKSNKDTSSDYEVEIRLLIDKKGGNSSEIFPEHYQTNVIGLK